MQQNKPFIDAVIRNRKDFKYSTRKHSDQIDQFSKLKKYEEKQFQDDVYHNDLIDCVKFKFNQTTFIINARNGY